LIDTEIVSTGEIGPGGIVGIVISAIVLSCCCFFICFIRRRKKNNESEKNKKAVPEISMIENPILVSEMESGNKQSGRLHVRHSELLVTVASSSISVIEGESGNKLTVSTTE